MKKIAILVGESLLAQGILSYISQLPTDAQTCAIYLTHPTAREELMAFQPHIIIAESQHLSETSSLPLASILALFPHVAILEMQLDTTQVRLIQSDQHTPASLSELLQILQIQSSLFSSNSVLPSKP